MTEPDDHAPEDDLTDPDYHAPNKCDDPNCAETQCLDGDDGALLDDFPEKLPGEDIWWKTHDNWLR